MVELTLNILRRYAVARTLFQPISLSEAINRLAFVQIDPINSPACAQDLILRHRVVNYQNGDMERAYPELNVEEAYFLNHGFLPRHLFDVIRANRPLRTDLEGKEHYIKHIKALLKKQPEIRAKDVSLSLGERSVKNAWGGTSSEANSVLQTMYSSGLLRIVRREKGLRTYGAPLVTGTQISQQHVVETILQSLMQIYAPMTQKSLVYMCRLVSGGRPELKTSIKDALLHIDNMFDHTSINGVQWYWPHDEHPLQNTVVSKKVRLLAPFDPIVWDRDRFFTFWNWPYKFEAYKPLKERRLGYYAMPLLWQDQCVGWGNLSVVDGVLHASIAYAHAQPQTQSYTLELKKELERMSAFLRCQSFIVTS